MQTVNIHQANKDKLGRTDFKVDLAVLRRNLIDNALMKSLSTAPTP